LALYKFIYLLTYLLIFHHRLSLLK